MIVLKAKVGSRGQVVIPKPIRDMFHIHPNENVTFRVEQNEILLRKEKADEILNRIFTLYEKKKPAPDNIDWGGLYYSQFED